MFRKHPWIEWLAFGGVPQFLRSPWDGVCLCPWQWLRSLLHLFLPCLRRKPYRGTLMSRNGWLTCAGLRVGARMWVLLL